MERTTLEIAKQINYNLDQYLHDLIALTLLPLYHTSPAGNPSELEEILTKNPITSLNFAQLLTLQTYVNNNLLLSKPDDITGVHILDNNRNRLDYFQKNQKEYNLPILELPYYEESKKARGKYIVSETISIPLTYNPEAHNQVFSIYRLLNVFETNKPYAMLVLDIKLNKMNDLLSTITIGEGAIVRIVSASNHIIYSTHSEENTTHFELPSPKDWLIGESELSNVDWKLIISVPIDSVTHRADLVLISLIIMLAAIVSAMVFSNWFSQKITKPLQHLQRLMKQAESGEFNLSFHTKSRDEIYHLGNSFNYMLTQIKDLINKTYITEIHQKEAEFAALQSQISPHFLFNTLESIRMVCEIEGNKQSVSMITALGKLLNENMQQKRWITLQEEITYIHNYLYLQSMRMPYPLRYSIECNPTLLSTPILAFLIQPLVENSILHGLSLLFHSGDIQITIEREEDESHLRITVLDNGSGISEEKLKKIELLLQSPYVSTQNGIGLININQRMIYTYGKRYGLKVESEEHQGTKITLFIPLSSDSQEKELTLDGTV
ncbi:sensor histidine kinase [Paenibacillus eucommiae]|uniref:Two-component system sensor histidine kinase YesM n=1 Tax=Paenibacillus eucommiae TaxID=1355755 RepID=A0ABS4JAF5_9BACL|nr:two-component system sensor histidine kinase YesM [Paenibacillus eucommiae]